MDVHSAHRLRGLDAKTSHQTFRHRKQIINQLLHQRGQRCLLRLFTGSQDFIDRSALGLSKPWAGRSCLCRLGFEILVRAVGLEPTRRCHRGILSPLRLPVPPRPRPLFLRAFCDLVNECFAVNPSCFAKQVLAFSNRIAGFRRNSRG
jgi:hypothetical protein